MRCRELIRLDSLLSSYKASTCASQFNTAAAAATCRFLPLCRTNIDVACRARLIRTDRSRCIRKSGRLDIRSHRIVVARGCGVLRINIDVVRSECRAECVARCVRCCPCAEIIEVDRQSPIIKSVIARPDAVSAVPRDVVIYDRREGILRKRSQINAITAIVVDGVARNRAIVRLAGLDPIERIASDEAVVNGTSIYISIIGIDASAPLSAILQLKRFMVGNVKSIPRPVQLTTAVSTIVTIAPLPKNPDFNWLVASPRTQPRNTYLVEKDPCTVPLTLNA